MNPELPDGLDISPGIVKFISFRERSVFEVRNRLRRDGLSDAEIESIIELLCSRKILDDRRFANHRIEYRINSGYGPVKIQDELHGFGVEEGLIQEELSKFDDSFFIESLRGLFSRKVKPVTDRDQRKLVDHFLRRGFTFSQVEKVMKVDFDYED